VIKLYDRQEVETTPAEQEAQRQSEFQDLINQWRLEAEVDINPNWMNFVPGAP
jgi:hypothetical protein